MLVSHHSKVLGNPQTDMDRLVCDIIVAWFTIHSAVRVLTAIFGRNQLSVYLSSDHYDVKNRRKHF